MSDETERILDVLGRRMVATNPIWDRLTGRSSIDLIRPTIVPDSGMVGRGFKRHDDPSVEPGDIVTFGPDEGQPYGHVEVVTGADVAPGGRYYDPDAVDEEDYDEDAVNEEIETGRWRHLPLFHPAIQEAAKREEERIVRGYVDGFNDRWSGRAGGYVDGPLEQRELLGKWEPAEGERVIVHQLPDRRPLPTAEQVERNADLGGIVGRMMRGLEERISRTNAINAAAARAHFGPQCVDLQGIAGHWFQQDPDPMRAEIGGIIDRALARPVEIPSLDSGLVRDVVADLAEYGPRRNGKSSRRRPGSFRQNL